MPSIEDYINSFPNPIITKIEGQPTYETLAEIQRTLTANASSVRTTLGGGHLGYLALVMDPVVYATHAGKQCIPPGDPGLLPLIPFGATVTVTSELV